MAILLVLKAGLYKVFLGIGLVIAAIKSMVVMAWALAISKYLPDSWAKYKKTDALSLEYQQFVDKFERRPTGFPGSPHDLGWLLDVFRRQGR